MSNSELLKRPLEFQADQSHDQNNVTASKEQEPSSQTAVPSGDDEGFKTPTYNQIPAEIKKCPPSPRKPKPPLASTKRKFSSSSSSSSSVSSKSMKLGDMSQEVNSLFPNSILDDLHRKIKKARKDIYN